MKREILFRGWDSNRKQWVYGGIHEYIADDPPFERVSIRLPVGPGVNVIPDSVGQFTGLRDKNGVRVFEGKLNENSTVEWHENTWWVFTHGKEDMLLGDCVRNNLIEVSDIQYEYNTTT